MEGSEDDGGESDDDEDSGALAAQIIQLDEFQRLLRLLQLVSE